MSTHPPEGDGQREWVDPQYAEVVARVTAHAATSGHRPRRRGFPFNGVQAFIVPGAEGQHLACCTCLHRA